MKDIIVQRLLESFGELERAIASAKSALGRRGSTPASVLARIATYEEMLEKQRELFTALCGYAKLGDWVEVSRHIKLINGLSEMIRDDAREVAVLLQPGQVIEHDEQVASQFN